MDKVLEQLSKLLGVGTDALEKAVNSVGSNYQEVYQTLVHEMAIKSVADNFRIVTIVLSIIGIAYYLLIGANYYIEADKVYPNKDNLQRYKKHAIGVSKIFIPLYLASLLFISLSPLLYPNLNLILELLNKAGG
ncbi:hypothetical protein BU202_08165 [Streptococcus cuniculi]|uniref:Uncharacterized protein n=1 Tax=Streptococcus cuniculi TaxID=1432788 RepID=A0A1Q8E691_9STRE|nr:hypothetical protein [Streptococcus cuniculi]OLF47291.1 hypothetical protein BU202_08165 [Streptococcus cuniculi]